MSLLVIIYIAIALFAVMIYHDWIRAKFLELYLW